VSADKPAAAEPPAVDPKQVRQVQELKHASPLIGCRFDPTGRFVFAGAQDSTVVRWEMSTGKKTALAGHKSWVRGLAFQPQTKTLFTAGYDGRILCWPVEADAPTPTRALDAHHGWVRAVAVSPDGKLLASCGNDNLAKLWSAADGRPVRELAGHACHVYNVAFHPDGRQLVSADLMGVVKHWELSSGKLVRELDAAILHKYDPVFRADHGGIRGIAFSRDGSLLACSGITDVTNAFAGVGKPLVVLFDWAAGTRKQLLVPKENFQGTGWGVAFHPAGFVVGAAGGNGGLLSFWKPEQAAAFFALKLPNNARDLDLHPDGRCLAVPFFDGAVRVYDLGPKKPA
jgi:WD40 repeat protein